MSDNEDLLGDDLGDHSLADYNLGNEEEEQLLADDYEMGASQNVPTSVGPYGDGSDMGPNEYSPRNMGYNPPTQYRSSGHVENECIVPNITVEVPNAPIPDHSTYAPYEPPVYEAEHAVVPPAIPASPIESPQIVPSELTAPLANGERERFVSERPVGAQRTPQVRNIPDSLDKVFVPRGGFHGRGRNSWRNPQFRQYNHPYRRNNMHRGNFAPRPSFPPPQIRQNQIRPEILNEPRPQIRPEQSPQIRPEILVAPPEPTEVRPEIPQEPNPEIHPGIRPEILERPEMHPNPMPIRPDLPPGVVRQEMPRILRPEIRPDLPPGMPPRPDLSDLPPGVGPDLPMEIGPFRMENTFQRFPFRPNVEERPFPRPYEPRPMFYQPQFNPRFGPPVREIVNNLPQVTIRQEPEVRMLPVLPPIIPPGGLTGKKVLINPHFKGNFQPPVEAGPIKDIDDAAERFIAEQRNALARAANRNFSRRSPQRYIENTTIEIENELARPRRSEDEELLRRQEEFINANRAGLRRRMRSPSPVRRSPSPRRSPDRRADRADRSDRSDRPDRSERSERSEKDRAERRPAQNDEDSEYRRRLREQESLRERVLRAKEVRRRKNAVLLQKQIQEREREKEDRETQPPKPEEPKPDPVKEPEKPKKEVPPPKKEIPPPKKEAPPPKEEVKPTSTLPEVPKPDTTRKSPEKPKKMEIERSPLHDETEVNSTCDALTPPRASPRASPPRALTPPLPPLPRRDKLDSDVDDELDLILDDIDGILSDEDDSGRFKEKAKPAETPKPQVDLRSKLPPKPADVKRPPRQKITFNDNKEREKEREEKKKREKSPVRRTIVTSSTKAAKTDVTDEKLETEKEKANKQPDDPKQAFSNRRVILQRKPEVKKSIFARIDKTDPTKPHPGIFSRAVRTAISSDNRIVIKRRQEVKVEYESESDYEEGGQAGEEGAMAAVANLPHGMTDTRLKTLAGSDVQSLELDKAERTARITFKSSQAAESFKKKFNNKMVAASRLTVTLS